MTTVFNSIMRRQVYLEGFKAGTTSLFRDLYLQQLDTELRKIFAVLKVERLDDLNKAEINALIAKIVGLLGRVFGRYTTDITKLLRRFMEGERGIVGAILSGPPDPFATPLYGPKAVLSTKAGRDRLWAVIVNSPMPGMGTFMNDTLGVFETTASVKITGQVRASVANGLTPAEALSALVGDPSTLFGNALLTKFDFQNTALISTIIQHISSVVTAALGSELSVGFTWASVLDTGTTDICIERAGRYFTFAEGPLPPAHYKCRSFIVPERVKLPHSFAEWLLSQPPELVLDMLSSRNAEDSIRNPKALSLDDYVAKLDNMLA